MHYPNLIGYNAFQSFNQNKATENKRNRLGNIFIKVLPSDPGTRSRAKAFIATISKLTKRKGNSYGSTNQVSVIVDYHWMTCKVCKTHNFSGWLPTAWPASRGWQSHANHKQLSQEPLLPRTRTQGSQDIINISGQCLHGTVTMVQSLPTRFHHLPVQIPQHGTLGDRPLSIQTVRPESPGVAIRYSSILNRKLGKPV